MTYLTKEDWTKYFLPKLSDDKSFSVHLKEKIKIQNSFIRLISKILNSQKNSENYLTLQKNYKMSITNITIPAGGMYQEWSCLMDLVEEDTAKTLEQLANKKGWREVQVDEAKEMGFGELAEWSVPETDVLVLIDDNYLVCLHKGDAKMN